jgi:hypothetical protein
METMTLELPKPIFEKLIHMAELSHRPVVEYLSESLDLKVMPDVPAEMQAELAQMIYLNDKALWDATQPVLSPKEVERLRELNRRLKESGLSTDETREIDALVLKYNFSTLRRARAFALLKLRGFTIPFPSSSFEDVKRA